MARLIDADKLQEAVQKAMEEYDGYSPYDRLALSGLVVADDMIDDAPTVEEAVVPVLCKDCKYWEPISYYHRTDGLCLCLSKYHDAGRPMTEGDFYCAYGKKSGTQPNTNGA